MKFPYRIRQIEKIGQGYLVIYHWESLSDETFPKLDENVQYLSETGEVLWTVNGMEDYDCGYWKEKEEAFSYYGDNGVLIDYSGNAYTVDMKTGRITYSHWLK